MNPDQVPMPKRDALLAASLVATVEFVGISCVKHILDATQ